MQESGTVACKSINEFGKDTASVSIIEHHGKVYFKITFIAYKHFLGIHVKMYNTKRSVVKYYKIAF